jgi:PKHD-type hydroxylase
MITKYPLLNSDTCDEIVRELDNGTWDPGNTSEYTAKNNLEQDVGSKLEASQQASKIIAELGSCRFFINKVLPKRFGNTRFNRYQDGGGYGKHTDSPIMGSNAGIRSDLAVIVFLTDPESYEGGELVLEYTNGAIVDLKESKGMMVYYPPGVIHSVRPVTQGKRTCFVTWVESHVRDAQQREILSDITSVCDDMIGVDGMDDYRLRTNAVRHNLFRQWV